jgi:hypothetical protein
MKELEFYVALLERLEAEDILKRIRLATSISGYSV